MRVLTLTGLEVRGGYFGEIMLTLFYFTRVFPSKLDKKCVHERFFCWRKQEP